MYYSILLSMNGAAKLIAFARGNVQLLSRAAAEIRAVSPAAGRAVVAGGNDLVVSHDDGAVFAPQAGGAFQNGIGDVEIVVLLAGTVIHGAPPGAVCSFLFYSIYRNRGGKSRMSSFFGGTVVK